jgi:hypothetical protein
VRSEAYEVFNLNSHVQLMRCFQSRSALSSHAAISQAILTHGSVRNMAVTFPGPGRAAPHTLRITAAFPTECNLGDTHKHFVETCCLSCPLYQTTRRHMYKAAIFTVTSVRTSKQPLGIRA